MNNTGVCGLTAQKLSLSMRVFGPRNSAYAVNLTYETYRHTYIYTYIYISREISIEHPSVGLASLAQQYMYVGEVENIVLSRNAILSTEG